MNIKIIDLGGQTIRVAVRKGKPNTIPLLIMNGIGASLELLTPFVEALPADIEVITFDCPGVGGSSTPCLPYRFSGLAKIITQMLDCLNYGQVDVLGLSWGGMLAQQFVYDYPHRVGKLILCATATGITSVPPSLKVLSLMASPRRYTDEEYFKSISADIYGGKFRTDKKLATRHATRMSESKGEFKHSQLGYMYQQAALCWWTSLYFLHSIKQPTLVLAGGDDPLIPLVNMKVIAKMIPNSKLRVFEDEGHLFLLTSVGEAVGIIGEFLL